MDTYEKEKSNNIQPETENIDNKYVSSTDNKSNQNILRKRTTVLKSSNRFIYICLIIALIGCLLFTPIFNVRNIVIEGNEKTSADKIERISGIKKGENILKADTAKAALNIKSIPWIDSVTISRKFPNTITIKVTECKTSAYIKFSGNLIAIDKNGKILEIVSKADSLEYPIVNGITPDEVGLGKTITSKNNQEALNELYLLVNELENNDFIKNISKIEINKNHNIILTLINNITVELGKKDNMSYKISYLKEIYKHLEDKDSGTLDLSNPENSAKYRESY